MVTLDISPLSWPPSGRPPAGSTNPPLIVYIVILLIGGLATLAVRHPAVLFAAVLVCGVLFSWATRNQRKPVVVHIREQLLGRTECLHLWADDSERLELAAVLCTALARAKGWPNARFIPEDPMELAFFEISGVDGDAEIFEVGAELTKKTGVKIDWQKLRDIAGQRTPMLIDLLEASLKRHEERQTGSDIQDDR